MSPRLLRPFLILLAGTSLLIACFHRALNGEQFSYRDAAHFYYPLYQRVQAEWDAGRWPLWEPEENAGTPLLGNPTAAVLYPGKIIYALLPYPLAARTYVIAHLILAAAGGYLLARQLALSHVGAAISGLTYAFSAPILFQYCNIIFLVGAAWTPFAFLAADRWLRQGDRWGIAILAASLAMQVLGGDPQIAYMTGLCAGGYALLLIRDRREKRERRGGWILPTLLGGVALVAWIAAVLAAARFLPGLRPPASLPPTPTFPWSAWVSKAVLGVWGGLGFLFLRGWIKGRPDAKGLAPMLIGLVLAAIVAAALCGAQLLPVLEFARLSGRSADEGAHDYYPFSLEPIRILEFLIPNLFGTTGRGNHFWLGLIPPRTTHRIWVPSLYMSGLGLILALSALGFREGPVWKRWFSLIVVFSLAISLGEFGGPLFWARRIEAMTPIVGKPDPNDTNTIRMDRQLRDGDGSLYWALTIALPGFQSFRFPSKFLTLTFLGLSALAGLGWDRLLEDRRKSAKGWSSLFGLLALGSLAALLVGSKGIRSVFGEFRGDSAFGPFIADGAYRDLLWGVAQALAVAVATLLILRLIPRRPRLAEAIALGIVAVDLAVANAGLIWTAPQAAFDAPPKFLKYIEEAEKANPSNGPYRIHRMAIWNPFEWSEKTSRDRVLDFLVWERDTLQPKYGINLGVEYTYTRGTAELFDYEWFFGPFTQPVSEGLARQLGKISPKERIVYYPRRGFDMWNTRYFILPGYTIWTDTDRGVASLLLDTEPIYPRPGTFLGAGATARYEDWVRTEDVQIHRNRNAMPRAWIVHDARFSKEIASLSRIERKDPMEEMTYAADQIWNDPRRTPYDPRKLAWIEVADPEPIRSALAAARVDPGDSVKVVRYEPQRVELDVRSRDNGVVVLADTFYPGWSLTIDGEPRPIIRANRLMRGALVGGSTQTRRLVYTYDPASFRWGLQLSLAGIAGLLGLVGWSALASWKNQGAGRRAPTP